jgi:hypothetical protein
MRRYFIFAARICVIAITVWVLWQLPQRAETAFLGSSLDESDDAVYHLYKYILWPVLSVVLLWLVYFLIVRLTRPRPSTGAKLVPK